MSKTRNMQRIRTRQKFILTFLMLIGVLPLLASNQDESFKTINNFHFVSDQLASSGMLESKDYDLIKAYGFKHVINLIPGMQLKERKHVESLGLSYEQIPVVWDEPTLENFQEFVKFMKAYDNDKVYVHCELNWRASTFVYLYRVTQLGISDEIAKKDLLSIWTPEPTWQAFIDSTLKAYQG